MKSLFVLAALTLSTQSFAANIYCFGEKAFQEGESKPMKANVDLNFQLNRETKEITKVLGHVFVQGSYTETEDEIINIENSYMGFFSTESLKANPNYRPKKYKGFTQYKNFDAAHTAGQETGMWGELVLDLSKSDKFEGRYIFKAGDHIGGTVNLVCSEFSER